MNRTFYMKFLYGFLLIALIFAVVILSTKINKEDVPLLMIFFALVLLIPGRVSQFFYQDLYVGRKYFDKKDFEKALSHLIHFENNIEKTKWKKIFLWMTWPIYTLDVLAMVKYNISSTYINLGDIEKAKQYIMDAINIDKKYALPYLNLAIISKLNEDEEEFKKNIIEARRLGMRDTVIDMFLNKMQAVYAKVQSTK